MINNNIIVTYSNEGEYNLTSKVEFISSDLNYPVKLYLLESLGVYNVYMKLVDPVIGIFGRMLDVKI
jgi:hypothetical protein